MNNSAKRSLLSIAAALLLTLLLCGCENTDSTPYYSAPRSFDTFSSTDSTMDRSAPHSLDAFSSPEPDPSAETEAAESLLSQLSSLLSWSGLETPAPAGTQSEPESETPELPWSDLTYDFPAEPEWFETTAAEETTEPPVVHTDEEHEFSEWEVLQEPSCMQEGLQICRCICGAELEETIPALLHDYSATGFCSVCGERNASVGLDMREIDGERYAVVGPGACTDANLIIPDTYLAKPVTEIGDCAFQGQNRLTSVSFGSNVNRLGAKCFDGCILLTEIDVPGSVKSLGECAFANCSGLHTVTLGEGIEQMDFDVFQNCVGLTELKLPDSLQELKAILHGCTFLKKLELGDGLTSINYKVLAGLQSLEELRFGTNIRVISRYNFESMANLKTIRYDGTIADWIGIQFECIEATPFRYGVSVQLQDRPMPEHLVIPEGVETIEPYALYESKIRELTLPSSLMQIGSRAFSQMKNLTAVHGLENTSIVEIPEGLFYGCEKLNSISFPDTLSVIRENAFLQCTGLEELTLPSGLTEIGEYAFCEAKSLTAVYGLENTSLTELRREIFENCKNLKHIEFPYTLIAVRHRAFCGCESLEEINFGTALQSIAGHVFEGCKSLRKIHFGISLRSIGSEAFLSCGALTELLYDGTEATWAAVELDWGWDCYCPLSVTFLGK